MSRVSGMSNEASIRLAPHVWCPALQDVAGGAATAPPPLWQPRPRQQGRLYGTASSEHPSGGRAILQLRVSTRCALRPSLDLSLSFRTLNMHHA